MSARVIHVGDLVHLEWSRDNIVAYTVESISESDLGVLLHLRTFSGGTICVSADAKNIRLAAPINGVTVGADDTVETSTPADAAGDTEAGTEDEPMSAFGYVVQSSNESFGTIWYTGELDAPWSCHRNQALVFTSRDSAEQSTASWAACRVRPLVAGDAGRVIEEAVVGYVIRVLPTGQGNTVYVGRPSWTTYPKGSTVYPTRDEALRVLATISVVYPRAEIVPLFPDPEGLPAATESEPKPTPGPVFGYVVTGGEPSEWIDNARLWTSDPQFARIFRGNESEESACPRSAGAALRERPNRRRVPLVEATGQHNRHVFGYVVQSPGRLTGPDDCAEYWTGMVHPSAWSTDPLKAKIFRSQESAAKVRWKYVGDARVLRLVGGTRCS